MPLTSLFSTSGTEGAGLELVITLDGFTMHFGYGSAELVRDERNRPAPRNRVNAYVIVIDGLLHDEEKGFDLDSIHLRIEGHADLPTLIEGVAIGSLQKARSSDAAIAGTIHLPRTMVRDLGSALRQSPETRLRLYTARPDATGPSRGTARQILGISASLLMARGLARSRKA